MKIVSVANEEATITISRKDLGFLQSAINETTEALDDRELRIRTGQTPERAHALLDEIKAICEAIDNHE
jgi:hypothetical protein